jgi:hypothetical protein
MKMKPGDKILRIGDVEIYGYTANEKHRVIQWQNHNTDRIIECPLIPKFLTKEDCHGIIESVGIDLPLMYHQGFQNNNCVACVKARDAPNYWKRIRKYYPEEFQRMAELERKLNFQINRISINGKKTPTYLDELTPGEPSGNDEVKVSCGLFCMSEAASLTNKEL